jgi:hypothetical protein
LLVYHVGFTFTEAWNMPIQWRRWFVQRFNHELEKQAEAQNDNKGSSGVPNLSKLIEDRVQKTRK